MYLPRVLFFIKFVSDCIAGYIISTSRKIRFANIIIAILLLSLLFLYHHHDHYYYYKLPIPYAE